MPGWKAIGFWPKTMKDSLTPARQIKNCYDKADGQKIKLILNSFLAFNKEIGHIHWNGELDILFNRKVKAFLLERNWVEEYKWVSKSGWTTLLLVNANFLNHGLKLLRISYLQKKKKKLGLISQEIDELLNLGLSEDEIAYL